MTSHGIWQRSEEKAALATPTAEQSWTPNGELVPTHLRWPIAVLCRDITYSHKSGYRLMNSEDISDFLQDDLYGEEWNENDLERALHAIYANGGVSFDQATLLPCESWLTDSDRRFWFVEERSA